MSKRPGSKSDASRTELIAVARVERSILLLRGQKVLLDSDLAEVYGVTTKVLNQAVKRNLQRFPGDFMVRLTQQEVRSLRSQTVTSNTGRGGRRSLPYAFTEHGAVMLASVLNSPRAVEASLYVVRAFVRLRQFAATHEALREKLDELEKKLEQHDEQFAAVFEAIRQLMEPDEGDDPDRPRIGYQTELSPSPPPLAKRPRRRKALKQAPSA